MRLDPDYTGRKQTYSQPIRNYSKAEAQQMESNLVAVMPRAGISRIERAKAKPKAAAVKGPYGENQQTIEDKQKVSLCLAAAGGPMKRDAISAETGIPGTRIKPVLTRMVKAAMIRKVGPQCSIEYVLEDAT